MPRILLVLALVLSGCTAVARPALAPAPTSAPTETPAAFASDLPAAADVAGWRLTTQELEYIRYFRYIVGYFPDRLPKFFDRVEQLKQDPQMMGDNQWRASVALSGAGMSELGVFFDNESPSSRFDSIVAAVTDIESHFMNASDLIGQAIDQDDAALLSEAAREVQAAQAGAETIGALFTTLVGPPD